MEKKFFKSSVSTGNHTVVQRGKGAKNNKGSGKRWYYLRNASRSTCIA